MPERVGVGKRDRGERQVEKSGKTSKASDGCFIKASLCLRGIATVYLASFTLSLCFPKGATGNFFPPKYTSKVSAGTHALRYSREAATGAVDR